MLIPRELTQSEVMGRFNAYRRFREEFQITEMKLEHWRITEDHGYLYGVTPDIVGKIDGVPCVIECKNTYSAEVTHPIQTAAQVISCAGLGNPLQWLRAALYLKGDGNYKIVKHRDPYDFIRWRKMLAGFSEAAQLRKELLVQ